MTSVALSSTLSGNVKSPARFRHRGGRSRDVMGNMDPAKCLMNRCRVQLRRSLPTTTIAAVVILSVLTLTSRLLVGSQNAPSQQLSIVANVSSECLPHPLLSREVDPANYEYGCEDFKDMLEGNSTYLGQGHIRDVWLVHYKGRSLVLKPLRIEDEPKRQKHRIQMHQSEAAALDSVRGHPNIVGMLGICDTTIATDYYSEFLHERILSGPNWTTGLSVSNIMTMARDAARGLQALHEAAGGPIVHFDMKPQQLLLSDDGRVKLNDLNRAQFMRTNGSGQACPFKGGRASRPSSWVAPEKIAWEPLTEKSDVYSMGMVFYSLISGREPFGQTEIDELKLLKGIMPYIDPSWHHGYMQLVQDMWHRESAERPSARQVVGRLEVLLSELLT